MLRLECVKTIKGFVGMGQQQKNPGQKWLKIWPRVLDFTSTGYAIIACVILHAIALERGDHADLSNL